MALALVSTPAQASDLQYWLNTLITNINTSLTSPLSLAFVANGSVATTVTSLGPTGSHTTIQEWATIPNASGVTRYIPLY